MPCMTQLSSLYNTIYCSYYQPIQQFLAHLFQFLFLICNEGAKEDFLKKVSYFRIRIIRNRAIRTVNFLSIRGTNAECLDSILQHGKKMLSAN